MFKIGGGCTDCEDLFPGCQSCDATGKNCDVCHDDHYLDKI